MHLCAPNLARVGRGEREPDHRQSRGNTSVAAIGSDDQKHRKVRLIARLHGPSWH